MIGAALLRALGELRAPGDWPYDEPSSLEAITATLPTPPRPAPLGLDGDALRDRLLAAWSGRVAGCILGKADRGLESGCHPHLPRGARRLSAARVPAAPADARGGARRSWRAGPRRRPATSRSRRATTTSTSRSSACTSSRSTASASAPQHVAAEWLDHFPFTQIFTAERAAYRNLVHGMRAAGDGGARQPVPRMDRRADPRRRLGLCLARAAPISAAALAFQDASLSHTANGIYGAMWAAALIAASFTAADLPAALSASLASVPPRSRLAEALRHVIELHAQGLDWEAARDEIETAYGHYSWVHTINNAAIVAAALLWGGEDFTKSVGLAVQAGWDTDCNGATVGSAFGARYGTAAIPERWVAPLNDHLRSALFGFDNSKISDLAERTAVLAEAHLAAI